MLLDVVVGTPRDLDAVPAGLDVGGESAKEDEGVGHVIAAELAGSALVVPYFAGGPRAKAALTRAARSVCIAALAEVGCPGACISGRSHS